MEFALHPTLHQGMVPGGRRGQRLVEAPGNQKVHGFGLVDWRDGWMHTLTAPGRAQPFLPSTRAAVVRSRSAAE